MQLLCAPRKDVQPPKKPGELIALPTPAVTLTIRLCPPLCVGEGTHHQSPASLSLYRPQWSPYQDLYAHPNLECDLPYLPARSA